MACRLFSAKPLSKPMLGYCQLDPKEQTNWSETSIKMKKFSFTKMHMKISSTKQRPFCPGGDELIILGPYCMLAGLEPWVIPSSSRSRGYVLWMWWHSMEGYIRADFRFAPNQWEMALLCNNVSHWLGASLDSALYMMNELNESSTSWQGSWLSRRWWSSFEKMQ